MFILVAALELCVLVRAEEIQRSHSGSTVPPNASSQHSVQSQPDQPNGSTTTDPSRYFDNVSETTMTVERAVPNFNESDFSDEYININSTNDYLIETDNAIEGKPVSTFNFADFDYATELNSSIDSQSVSDSKTAIDSADEDSAESDDADDTEASVSGQRENSASDNHNTSRVRLNQTKDHSADHNNEKDEVKPESTYKFGDSYVNYPNGSMIGPTWNSSWKHTFPRPIIHLPISAKGYASIGGRPLLSFKFNDLHMYPGFERLTTEGAGEKGSLSDIRDRVGTTETTDQAVGQGNTDRRSFEDDWLLMEATSTENRLPWQVGVFSKHQTPPARVCGGSLVTRAAVVSAAHCFWQHAGLLPASQFAVGAGGVLPHRGDDYSSYRQQNDVAAVKVPPDFRGSAGAHGDIAVLLLVRPLFDEPRLRPVCVSFDRGLEDRQLVAGSSATVLGVGLQKENEPTVLKRLEVPFIATVACGRVLDWEMLGDFTGDKICAGFKPDSSPALGNICSIDAGTGLAFFLGSPLDRARGIAVPFLRGVASSLPPACGARAPALYTSVSAHRAFLEEHLGGLERECERYYPHAPELQEEAARFVCNCYC